MSERKLRDEPAGKRGKKFAGDAARPPTNADVSERVPIVRFGQNDVVRGISNAFNVDPMEVARFQPTPEVVKVGEAVAAGLVQARTISVAAGINQEAVIAILNDPVAMVWISQRIEALFRYRAGLVDAALFQRAIAGETAAIKLFFERHKIMSDQKTVQHVYSGGVDVRGLPTDDLRKLVADKARMLPAEFRVLEITDGSGPKDAGAEVRGDGGNPAPSSGGPPPVLPAP